MASERLRRCVFEGCIGTFDSEIQKRPYHKNCGCALHHRPADCPRPCRGATKSVSYKIRKAWSESSLVTAAAAAGSGGGSAGSSPSTTPAWEKQPFAGSRGEDGKVVWEI